MPKAAYRLPSGQISFIHERRVNKMKLVATETWAERDGGNVWTVKPDLNLLFFCKWLNFGIKKSWKECNQPKINLI